MFNPVRRALGYRSKSRGAKRRANRQSALPALTAMRGGPIQRIALPIEKHPMGLAMPQFRSWPGIVRSPIEQPPYSVDFGIWRKGPREDQVRSVASSLGVDGLAVANIDFLAFARLLAKVGHGVAVSGFGATGFTPYLRDLILGRTQEWAGVVGGESKIQPPITGRHYVKLDGLVHAGRTLLLCEIRLFAAFGSPTYLVVAGEISTSHK
jgi:hypothetical protein